MAEAKSMEEALKAYQDGKFSRQSLFELVVARIKATEERQERLEGQMKDLVGALVRGMQDKPPEPARTVDSFIDTETLRVHAEELGVKVDKRWSTETLVAKIEAARSAYAGPGTAAHAIAEAR